MIPSIDKENQTGEEAQPLFPGISGETGHQRGLLRSEFVSLFEPSLELAENEDILVPRSEVNVTTRTLLISARFPKIFLPKFMIDSRVILAGSFLLSATARTN